MKIWEERNRKARRLKRHNPWERVLAVGWHIFLVGGILFGLVLILVVSLLWAIVRFELWNLIDRKKGESTTE